MTLRQTGNYKSKSVICEMSADRMTTCVAPQYTLSYIPTRGIRIHTRIFEEVLNLKQKGKISYKKKRRLKLW